MRVSFLLAGRRRAPRTSTLSPHLRDSSSSFSPPLQGRSRTRWTPPTILPCAVARRLSLPPPPPLLLPNPAANRPSPPELRHSPLPRPTTMTPSRRRTGRTMTGSAKSGPSWPRLRKTRATRMARIRRTRRWTLRTSVPGGVRRGGRSPERRIRATWSSSLLRCGVCASPPSHVLPPTGSASLSQAFRGKQSTARTRGIFGFEGDWIADLLRNACVFSSTTSRTPLTRWRTTSTTSSRSARRSRESLRRRTWVVLASRRTSTLSQL